MDQVDEEVYTRRRDIRRDWAKGDNVPAYMEEEETVTTNTVISARIHGSLRTPDGHLVY